jgi:hypothetical protein
MRQRAAGRVHSRHEDNVSTTVVRQSELPSKLRQPAFAKQFSASWSPGYVSSQLGITREGVYDLVKRGRLDAIRVVTDRKPHKLLAYVISEESVERFRETRYQRQTA